MYNMKHKHFEFYFIYLDHGRLITINIFLVKVINICQFLKFKLFHYCGFGFCEIMDFMKSHLEIC